MSKIITTGKYKNEDVYKKHLERLSKENERETHIKEIALTLLEQCKSEHLTINELYDVLSFMRGYAERNSVILGQSNA